MNQYAKYLFNHNAATSSDYTTHSEKSGGQSWCLHGSLKSGGQPWCLHGSLKSGGQPWCLCGSSKECQICFRGIIESSGNTTLTECNSFHHKTITWSQNSLHRHW